MVERLIRDTEGAIAGDGVVDGRRLLRGLAARKRWILGATFAAFAAALTFVELAHPRYMGVAKVLIENQESYFTRPDKASADPALVIDDEAIQSQAEIFSTPDMARKAVDQLGLASRPEFTSSTLGSLASAVLGGFVGRLFDVSARAGAEDRAIDSFLLKLSVFPVPKSRVIQVEFTSEDPALAARTPNLMAKLFLAAQQDAKKAEAKSAADWLSGRIEQLRAHVAEADARLEDFRSQSGLVTTSTGMTAPTQRLSEISSQIATARAAQAAASAKAQVLREMLRAGRLEDVPSVSGDESLRHFAETRVALKSQIAELGRTLLPNHPRMRELAGQLAGLDQEMREAALKRVRGYEDEARLAGDQVKSLDAAVADQAKAVAATDGDQVQLRALEAEARAAREQLDSYVAKYREATARDAADSAPANARIIETAVEPRDPVFPKKAPTLFLSTLAGLLISVGLAAASVLLGEEAAPAAAPAPAAEIAAAPEPLATAPVEPVVSPQTSPHRIVEMTEPTVDADAPLEARDLAERWALASPDGRLTLTVTGEGAPGALATALDVARALARRGRAVLVDLGQSQPWMADVLDGEGFVEGRPAGLSELLAGQASYEQALHRDLSSALHVLPLGGGPYEAEALAPVLRTLERGYVFVVLHASDWRSPGGACALHAATAVMVCGGASRLGDILERVSEALPDPVTLIEGVELPEIRRRERAA